MGRDQPLPTKNPTGLCDQDKLELIREVYQAVHDETESFEDPGQVGADLAYLLGAIAKDTSVDWTGSPTRELLRLLQKRFDAKHPVWRFIVADQRPSRGGTRVHGD